MKAHPVLGSGKKASDPIFGLKMGAGSQASDDLFRYFLSLEHLKLIQDSNMLKSW